MFDSLGPINEVDDKGVFMRYRMGPNLTNYGNSPADNVTVFVCDPTITDTVAQPNLTCKLSDKASPSGPIGPKQTWHILGIPIQQGDYDATQASKKFIYIFGYVTYNDGLKPENVHQTRFCQRIIKQNIPPNAPVGLIAMESVGCNDTRWSCFDDGCVGDPLALR